MSCDLALGFVFRVLYSCYILFCCFIDGSKLSGASIDAKVIWIWSMYQNELKLILFKVKKLEFF
jgi:hypothetical protein